MVVCENGDYAGSVSSGCLDNNVAAIALEVLQDGQQKRVKFGDGSPFVDVKLPCGGGVELLILPDPDPSVIDEIVDSLLRRRECSALLTDTGLQFSPRVVPTMQEPIGFYIYYHPKLQIIAAGRGNELISLVKASVAAGFEISVCSPDKNLSLIHI